MDNQQESLVAIKELSWLAGIIDGEGTITLRYKNRKNKTPLMSPVISIVNTNMIMIDEIARILKNNELAFWISESRQTKNWKPRKMIEVSGIKRVKKFLEKIETYLVAKTTECRLVKEWCLGRLSEDGITKTRENYSKRDFEVLMELRELHGHQDERVIKKYKKLLKSSETTR